MQKHEESIKVSDGWKSYLIKYINDRVRKKVNKSYKIKREGSFVNGNEEIK